ncbi:glycosyltransferase family 2 protein [Candidatus Woesearchaeota archaeon]|nr:glycosyltransferase family 2 protein [Candidatus Woesearchaeota archaeon]
MKIIVTIPAYNEETTIGTVIDDIKKALDKKHSYEIIVIDDGSTDRTSENAKKAGATVYSHQKNYGLAEAFKTAVQKAQEHKADIIVHTDADAQYDADDIPKLLEKISQGNDLVLGSRFKGNIESMPLINRIGNKAFSAVISQITRQKITDAQTGFRAFTKEAAKLPITSNYTYTQEQILRAARAKLRIAEVPITFRKRMTGKSRLIRNPIDYALKAWVTIFRIYRDYEPLKFFGMFGSFFLAIGMILGMFVLYSFLTTGFVGGIPRVVLAGVFITMGIQIILFGFLADMIKNRT